MKDLYEILDVPPTATSEQIAEQYHLLINAWHPDKFSSAKDKDKAEEKAKEINAAYQVLRNSGKRADYDRRRQTFNPRTPTTNQQPYRRSSSPNAPKHEPEGKPRPTESQTKSRPPKGNTPNKNYQLLGLGALAVIIVLVFYVALPAWTSFSSNSQPSAESTVVWETFEGDGFSFTLPSTFEGGSDQQDFAAVAEMYRNAGNETLAQSVEANAGFILLYAADTVINNSNKTYTNVNVIREQNPALVDYTIQDYVDISLSQLQAVNGITVIDQKEVSIPGFDAYLLIEEYDLSQLLGAEGTSKADQYLLKSGDTVWVITYTTDISEYTVRHADFETSAQSFTLK
jgi:hypothetical protein